MNVLITAYAINPFKGSEDGMGWNFVCQAARFNQVIAITRKNNRSFIEKYMIENPSAVYQNIKFEYFDLPYYLRFWKKGSRFSLLYFYLWQMFIPFFIIRKKIKTDLLHNLNFHNDWTPSFLWVIGKPFVWGPVGHHPKIPKDFILPIYGPKAYLNDRLKYVAKNIFWYLDPMLWLSRIKATKIFCMNSVTEKKINSQNSSTMLMPSVGSENRLFSKKENQFFDILSIGRFIPLKGFDIAIEAFKKFHDKLSDSEKKKVRLILVGKGEEEKKLKQMVLNRGLFHSVIFKNWMDREQLDDSYASASLFLFPSHEGAGMVVSEAFSYGLPVICFDNAGPGEFVNAQCGRKVAYSNYEQSTSDFADHLQSLFYNHEIKERLSRGARNRFLNMFDWNIKGEILHRAYVSALITN